MLLSQTNDNSTTRMQKFASLTWYDKFIEFIFRFTAVYGLESIREKDKIKAWLYLTLSLLLSLAGGIMLFMQLAGGRSRKSEHVPVNYIRVQAFLMENPNAKTREVASALSMSFPTASTWMRKVRGNG